jgi:hypothetical protein
MLSCCTEEPFQFIEQFCRIKCHRAVYKDKLGSSLHLAFLILIGGAGAAKV